MQMREGPCVTHAPARVLPRMLPETCYEEALSTFGAQAGQVPPELSPGLWPQSSLAEEFGQVLLEAIAKHGQDLLLLRQDVPQERLILGCGKLLPELGLRLGQVLDLGCATVKRGAAKLRTHCVALPRVGLQSATTPRGLCATVERRPALEGHRCKTEFATASVTC